MWQQLILLVATVLLVEAQNSSAVADDIVGCFGSFADANATGTVSYNSNVAQGAQEQQPDNETGNTLPITFAETVAFQPNSSTVQVSLWITTGGANYSDDFGLGYDVCALAIDTDTLPIIDQARGYNDNGSCHDMFDQSCVGAITDAAQEYALELILNPTPSPSNLTIDSLGTVCTSIASMLTANKPKECKNYFQDNTTFTSGSRVLPQPVALTGYNFSGIYSRKGCYTNGTGRSDPSTYWAISSDTLQEADESTYDAAVQLTYPLLSIWMPVANGARQSTIRYAQAGMQCIRAKNVTAGSRVPAALPSADSFSRRGGGLSGGAIAGIVVGVILGVAIIGGLAARWFMRRKKAAKTEGTVEKNVDTLDAAPDDLGSIGSPGTEVSELPPDWRRPELDAGKDATRYELPVQNEVKELLSDGKSDGPPVELEGTIPEDGQGTHRLA